MDYKIKKIDIHGAGTVGKIAALMLYDKLPVSLFGKEHPVNFDKTIVINPKTYFILNEMGINFNNKHYSINELAIKRLGRFGKK